MRVMRSIAIATGRQAAIKFTDDIQNSCSLVALHTQNTVRMGHWYFALKWETEGVCCLQSQRLLWVVQPNARLLDMVKMLFKSVDTCKPLGHHRGVCCVRMVKCIIRYTPHIIRQCKTINKRRTNSLGFLPGAIRGMSFLYIFFLEQEAIVNTVTEGTARQQNNRAVCDGDDERTRPMSKGDKSVSTWAKVTTN